MPKQTKRNTVRVPKIPKNVEEFNTFLDKGGRIDRRIKRREATLKDRIAKLNEDYAAVIAPLVREKNQLEEGIQAYSEENRDSLTENGKKKSAKFPTGIIGWRKGSKIVNIIDFEAVLKRLKKLKLFQYIRVIEEINKQVVLDNPEEAESVEGISITEQEEKFYIKYEERKVDVVDDSQVRKGKKP